MANINELKNRKLGPNSFKTPESTEVKTNELAKKIAARTEEKRKAMEKEETTKQDGRMSVVDVDETDTVISDKAVDTGSIEAILYDKEAEIEERARANGLISSGEETKPETPQEPDNPYKAICNPDGTVSEHQRNVFEDGLNDGTFVAMHACPMCHVGKKTIRGLEVRKKIGFFKFIQKRIGYMSICANCGHVDFYATDPDELLLYLRGKAKP